MMNSVSDCIVIGKSLLLRRMMRLTASDSFYFYAQKEIQIFYYFFISVRRFVDQLSLSRSRAHQCESCILS
jgi:hypothetical protein